jgi:hypothetical protein
MENEQKKRDVDLENRTIQYTFKDRCRNNVCCRRRTGNSMSSNRNRNKNLTCMGRQKNRNSAVVRN